MFSATFTINAISREDGGLRIWSDDLPGLLLSASDPSAVWRDLGPAIELIIKHNITSRSTFKRVRAQTEK